MNAKINSLANQKEKANTQLKKANSQIIELTSKITNLNSKIATNQKKIISQESQISNLDNQLKNSSKKNLKDRETITLLNSKNKILNDSSVPFDWYSDFEFFIKLLISKLLTKSIFSNPGVNVVFVFL